jgi:iron uptake system component EfeO
VRAINVTSMRRRSVVVLAVLGLALGAGLTACGSTASTMTKSDHTTAVDVIVTPTKCTADPPSVSPGTVTFTVTDKNAPMVTEVELRQPDGYLIAEKPNLTNATPSGFSASLSDGTYQIYCPGATQTLSNLTVSGASTSPSWKKNPALVAAVASFTTWVSQQMVPVVAATQAFAAAVVAGNLPEAEMLYVPARVDFETIEPEAETFASLYQDVDGQIQNFGNPSQFQGFHELEEAMWVADSLAGQSSYATQLVNNVKQLQSMMATVTYQPAQIIDFADAELSETTTNELTGAEERYSNLELVDVKGTFDSVAEGIMLLSPALQSANPAVFRQLNTALTTAQGALAGLAQNPGPSDSGYQSYTMVDIAQRQVLYQDTVNLITALGQATLYLP